MFGIIDDEVHENFDDVHLVAEDAAVVFSGVFHRPVEHCAPERLPLGAVQRHWQRFKLDHHLINAAYNFIKKNRSRLIS